MRMETEIYSEITRILGEGGRAALATVIASEDSTPGKPGFKMLVRDDGSTLGTVGGGALEAEVVRAAREVIAQGRSVLLTLGLGKEGLANIGMLCGGAVQVFVEFIGRGPRAVIFGAGHVGLAIGRVAQEAGFWVTLVDDREEFALAEAARFADEVVCKGLEEAAREVAFDDETYVVIVTRGHAHDLEVLRECLRKPDKPAYIGMIGSRKKVASTFDTLRREGVPAERLAEVNAPVGLAIGARTPGEIGVSVVAEMIARRRGAKGPYPEGKYLDGAPSSGEPCPEHLR